MNKNLYVGNLPFHTTAGDLTRVFGHFGTVVRAFVVTNPETNESRGFGYVEMSNGADQAVAALDKALYQERSLTVHQTKPREDQLWPDGDDRESIPVMPVYQPDEDDRESIPVMPDSNFRGWPTPIIDAPPSDGQSWAILYEASPSTRDADAYGATQTADDNDRPDALASRQLDEST